MRLVSPLVEYFHKSDFAKDYTETPGDFCKAVYLPITSTPINGNRIFFAPDTELDGENCTIKAIEVINNTTNVVSIGTSPSTDILPNSELAFAFMVLADGDEQLAIFPLVSLIRQGANLGKFQFTFSTNHKWHDSYVVINGGTITTDNSLWFNIWYDKI